MLQRNLHHRIFSTNKARAAFKLSTLMLALTFGTPALAALDSLGTLDQASRFPMTITDTNGVTLGLCFTQGHCPFNPDDLPNPAAAISFPGNFPGESFWYMATSTMAFTNEAGVAGTAALTFALEGTFMNATHAPRAGDQVLFSRTRIRVRGGLAPGQLYKVTHPHGVNIVTAGADGTVFVTDDCGIGIPGTTADFPNILTCPIGPFLTVVGPTLPPTGFHGTINDLVTVTGSPFDTNFFKIEGPGLGVNGITTSQFRIAGKLSTLAQPSGVLIESATYSRTTTEKPQAEVFVTAKTNSQVAVSSYAGVGSPVGHSIRLTQAMNGPTPTNKFYGNLDLVANPAGIFAGTIVVTDMTVSPPSFAHKATLVDRVTIHSAVYDLATRTLTVKAESSDKVHPLTLVALGVGPTNKIQFGVLSVVLSAPPATVTVQSSQGGSQTAVVALSGLGSTNVLIPDFAPPVANAGLDRTVSTNQLVELNAAASTGVIADYYWVQTAGTPVALLNAMTSTPMFTYPSTTGLLTFLLTAVGPGGISTDAVNVIASIPAVTTTVISPTVSAAEVRRDTAKATYDWVVEGTVDFVPTTGAGVKITSLIVTDAVGATVDLIASAGMEPLPIDALGLWKFKLDRTVNLTANLAAGQWRVHAVSSTGTVSPQLIILQR